VNHLLQHTLRSICTESQWVYAVLWRILPRNYPPPKILTWEDGFCDFAACVKSFKQSSSGDSEAASAEPLQPELFFKMSHEVYSYGEGLMGKVASDSSHKWIFRDPADQDSSLVSPWHGSLDPHPRTWEAQFKAGIQTIAIVAVQEGLLQLGSLDKVLEDLNLVILLQRKFTYLQTIPGVFAPHPNTLNHSIHQAAMIAGSSGRKIPERPPLSKSLNTGHSSPGVVPHLHPSMSSLHALLSKLPSVSDNALVPPP
ncbi:hypothetical protein SELMODRAFT_34641, partial [Selaginella moellendorffii]